MKRLPSHPECLKSCVDLAKFQRRAGIDRPPSFLVDRLHDLRGKAGIDQTREPLPRSAL